MDKTWVDKTWVVPESLPFGDDALNTLQYELNDDEIPADVAAALGKEDVPVDPPVEPPVPLKDPPQDPEPSPSIPVPPGQRPVPPKDLPQKSEKTPPAPVPLIQCMDQTFLDVRWSFLVFGTLQNHGYIYRCYPCS